MNTVGTQAVPTLTIVMILVSFLAGILLPLIFAVVLKKKHLGRASDFFVGCLVMLIFAFVLEQLAHTAILRSSVGVTLQNNAILFALYAGLMAGLFEETGRFVAFRTLLRKRADGSALMAGAGHGGFEAFVLLTVGMASNLVVALMVNAGKADVLTANLTGQTLATVQSGMQELTSVSPMLFLAGVAERVSAMIAQVSLSVLVWFAARKRAIGLFPLAIVLHMLLDVAAVMLNTYFALDVWVLEAAVAAITIVYALIAKRAWRKHAGK